MSCSSFPTKKQHSTSEPLSIWNQCAPRVYISVVLCFPLSDSAEAANRFLGKALHRVSRDHPIFSARLLASTSTNSDGLIFLEQAPEFEIPFDHSEISNPNFDIGGNDDYGKLLCQGFPAHLFVGRQFEIAGNVNLERQALPAAKVRTIHVPHGLLLMFSLHHSVFDGNAMSFFLEAFAAETRRQSKRDTRTQIFPVARSAAHGNSSTPFERVIQECNEFTILADKTGPTQPLSIAGGIPIEQINKMGKTFVFQKSQILKFRETIRNDLHASGVHDRDPTTYICLAALAFGHITRARLQTENILPSTGQQRPAKLWTPVDFRTRAFQRLTKSYLGNATLPAPTVMSTLDVVGACTDREKFLKVVVAIKAAISSVDEKYCQKRLDMMSAAPDPRLIGANYDPRMPEVLMFNTWRYFGADVEWHIPGVAVTKPDAIRRSYGAWGMGTALILPSKAEDPELELLVCLSDVAMEELCRDQEWMKMVERVVE